MDNKEKYNIFCAKNYAPIFSQPWWMDAVCGAENWDVWLYEPNAGQIDAAMPYYMEKRGDWRYITKAPLTQNNGIIFSTFSNSKYVTRSKFEDRVVNAACDFIESLGLDVYEQQFHYSYENWLPFFWRHYTAITRYTCVIEDTSDMQKVWNNLSSNYRNKIRMAEKSIEITEGFDVDKFYDMHERIFLRQHLTSPFSRDFWNRLYSVISIRDCGKILCARTPNGKVTSLAFFVWDEQSVYLLLGGTVDRSDSVQGYDNLVYEGIKLASQMGLRFDFEGSVICRIYRSFREFGPVAKPYFRIRKVLNPEIVRMEAEDYIKLITAETQEISSK